MANCSDAEEQMYLDVIEIFNEVLHRPPTDEELQRYKSEYETLLLAYGRERAIRWLIPKVRRCNDR